MITFLREREPVTVIAPTVTGLVGTVGLSIDGGKPTELRLGDLDVDARLPAVAYSGGTTRAVSGFPASASLDGVLSVLCLPVDFTHPELQPATSAWPPCSSDSTLMPGPRWRHAVQRVHSLHLARPWTTSRASITAPARAVCSGIGVWGASRADDQA